VHRREAVSITLKINLNFALRVINICSMTVSRRILEFALASRFSIYLFCNWRMANTVTAYVYARVLSSRHVLNIQTNYCNHCRSRVHPVMGFSRCSILRRGILCGIVVSCDRYLDSCILESIELCRCSCETVEYTIGRV
jgi:hypothetical protein